jgi:hypothetical protein
MRRRIMRAVLAATLWCVMITGPTDAQSQVPPAPD